MPCLRGGHCGEASQHQQLLDLARQRWGALAQKMILQADPLEFVLGAHGAPGVWAPGVSAGAPGMPANLEDIPAWYAKEYERKVWARKKELIHLNHYPEGQPGKQAPS